MMFAVLLIGIYAAYKHFSGLDPLKINPQASLSALLAGKIPKKVLGILSANKLTQNLSNQLGQKVLGQQSNALELKEHPEQSAEPNLLFKFLLIADSHNDNINLTKALSQAKAIFPDLQFIIGLGDYTDVGTIEELINTKKELDSAGLRYFLVAGEHDLWDSRNRQFPADTNFNQVFGPVYQSFTYNNFLFLLLDNSDDYLGIGQTQSNWIENELAKAKTESPKGIFVFLHEPLYHPSSDHVMGKTESSLKQQARDLMFQLKGVGVKKVFAADIHFFSQYLEPVTGLEMMTVGAVTIDRNPQAPRFGMVSVFEDGSTKIEDVEIK